MCPCVLVCVSVLVCVCGMCMLVCCKCVLVREGARFGARVCRSLLVGDEQCRDVRGKLPM